MATKKITYLAIITLLLSLSGCMGIFEPPRATVDLHPHNPTNNSVKLTADVEWPSSRKPYPKNIMLCAYDQEKEVVWSRNVGSITRSATDLHKTVEYNESPPAKYLALQHPKFSRSNVVGLWQFKYSPKLHENKSYTNYSKYAPARMPINTTGEEGEC